MVRRNSPRWCLLCGSCLALVPWPVLAQIPKRLEDCMPYPTLASEIARRKQEYFKTPEPKEPTIIVDVITYEGAPDLRPEEAQRLFARAKDFHLYNGDDSRIKELAEVGVGGALRDKGYFQAVVKSTYRVRKTEGKYKHVAVKFVIDEGLQYRLGKLQIRGNTAFSTEQLRQLIPLQEGDLFNVSRIRDGLEAMGELYASNGFIDFTPEPETVVDQDAANIDLILNLDEQVRYRIGGREVLGPDPKTEEMIRSEFKPGEVFNRTVLDELFTKYKDVLPADASWRDVEIRRNMVDGLVFIRLNFLTCPKLPN